MKPGLNRVARELRAAGRSPYEVTDILLTHYDIDHTGAAAEWQRRTGARTWLELLFLSTTTMTSTGLSDVVPVKPLARSVVMVQQIAGMLYLAVAVSRIVGLTIARRRAAREDA